MASDCLSLCAVESFQMEMKMGRACESGESEGLASKGSSSTPWTSAVRRSRVTRTSTSTAAAWRAARMDARARARAEAALVAVHGAVPHALLEREHVFTDNVCARARARRPHF